MNLTLLLPWFPILLAIGLGGRLLGRTRGFALGLLGALFWLALLQASGGRGLWTNVWTAATIVTGMFAIVAAGGWAGETAAESNAVGATGRAGGAPIPMHRTIERLAEAMAEFDEWLEQHRDDTDPWSRFDELIRTVMYRCCQATHVRPYRTWPAGEWLMPLRQSDPRIEVQPVPVVAGPVSDVLSTGRSYVAGERPRHGVDPAPGPNVWCFAISRGAHRVGIVTVGQLDICPGEHRDLLAATERLIGLFWGTLLEVCDARAAVLDDSASGLLLREAFVRMGQEALADSYRQAEPVAVAVLALEGLRQLNDVGRWEVADELIRAVGQALRAKARSDDQLGRFDGSRFLVLLRRVDADLANLIVAQMLGRLKAVCDDQTRWGVTVGVRCGVALSGAAHPDLRTLMSRSLAQGHRARVEGVPIASDFGPIGLQPVASERVPARGAGGQRMKIEQTQVGTVDVLTPVGALVDDEAEAFCKRLQQRLQSSNTRVVISLQEVPYMDSAALDGLVAAADELADRATSLKLTNVTPTCREILELTGLTNRFRLFATMEDAVKSFL